MAEIELIASKEFTIYTKIHNQVPLPWQSNKTLKSRISEFVRKLLHIK